MFAAILALPLWALGCGDGEMADGASPPVAATDSAITEFDTPILLYPTANDTADDLCLAAQTIDLDPMTPGQQASLATTAGTFMLEAGGGVRFTPASGFSGAARAAYVVADLAGRVSNPANLIVTVKGPTPGGDIVTAADWARAQLPRLVPAGE
jgi:mannan endo-1,4-beta-mannosidase